MGSFFSCASALAPAAEDSIPRQRISSSRRRSSTDSNSSATRHNRGWRSNRSEGNQILVDDQALVAAAALFIREQCNGVGAMEVDRSSSMRCVSGEMKKGRLVKSESSRSRLSTDQLFHPKQLVKNVILVGHDFGGACISHAMESFPSKISKAIYISATMLTNGQSTFDMFSQQEGTNDMMRKAQIFLYDNGNDNPPTAINIDRLLLKDLLFNQSPLKDVALASVSMRALPFAPLLERLSLTEGNYGSVGRFFIETTDDNAMPLSLQRNICDSNPPEKILRIKGSDHCPFFSRPQALHKLLVEIAKVSPAHQRTSD